MRVKIYDTDLIGAVTIRYIAQKRTNQKQEQEKTKAAPNLLCNCEVYVLNVATIFPD
jgi:hypothetical protein